MNAIRQDAWTTHDDRRLAEVTLRHIREGGTQLSAFAEVGQLIGRTQAACGFRWNSYLRKLHEQDVKQAKQHRQRMQVERRKPEFRKKAVVLASSAFDSLESLEWLQPLLDKWRSLQQDLTTMAEEIRQLRKENEDYRALLQILDRARNLTVGQ